MKPVVLIARNAPGTAFRYTRFAPAGRVLDPSTHVVELDAAPVGDRLPVLQPADVELFRTDPERLFAA